MVYMAYKKSELKHAWYAILDAMADSLLSPSSMRESADMPIEYLGIKVKKQHECVTFKYPAEESLHDEENCTLWNPSFIYAVDKLDHRDRGSAEGCYSFTKELLMDYLEKE